VARGLLHGLREYRIARRRVRAFELAENPSIIWVLGNGEGGFHPVETQALRRSFGRISHDDGVPVEEIQAVMGHSSSGITAEYAGVEESGNIMGMADDSVQDVVRRAPRSAGWLP